ncbi:MAG TPA: twin-arginine translocation signal domain-containing protein, partial [Caldilineaceae bacterium]|nr:twin-arginine translocation signal domain-containing protein [Caldilineaceae bacterium]
MAKTQLTRRRFLQATGGALSLAALAACVPAVGPETAAEADTGAAPSGAAMVSEDAPLWVLHTNDFHPDYNDFI